MSAPPEAFRRAGAACRWGMMRMLMDGHCDVLMKLYLDPELDFRSGPGLDVTLDRLIRADCRLQSFAVYLPMAEPTMAHVAAYARILRELAAAHPELHPVRTRQDLRRCIEERRVGAMLTLEGVDALQGNLDHVDELYELGVRSIGVTWNYANWAADGVLEPRQAALSLKGRQLVERCNQKGMILDVSHLAEPGFWELCERTARPPIASHANSYACCPHPRNLKDDQLKALFDAGGLIGLAFVPHFLKDGGNADSDDLLRHIEHIAALGGERNICFGSDFDGIDAYVKGLEHPGKWPELEERLRRYYSDAFVEGLYWRNAAAFYAEQLPDGGE